MPPILIAKDSTILVSGVNGFIASHVADQLLQDGYRVKGSVRSEAKGKPLHKYFEKKYGKERFELVVVRDIAHMGAFDEAVRGMTMRADRPSK